MWVIDIDARTITVHTPNSPPLTLTDADSIDGADYLPGFSCPVADLLPASLPKPARPADPALSHRAVRLLP